MLPGSLLFFSVFESTRAGAVLDNKWKKYILHEVIMRFPIVCQSLNLATQSWLCHCHIVFLMYLVPKGMCQIPDPPTNKQSIRTCDRFLLRTLMNHSSTIPWPPELLCLVWV